MPARVEELARALIEQHGTPAAHAAVERLNHSIDERLPGISGLKWFMPSTNTSGR